VEGKEKGAGQNSQLEDIKYNRKAANQSPDLLLDIPPPPPPPVLPTARPSVLDVGRRGL